MLSIEQCSVLTSVLQENIFIKGGLVRCQFPPY